MVWGVMAILEHIRRVGDPDAPPSSWDKVELHRARARTELLLCAAEQSSLDAGNWDLGWLWTHIPEPPFHKIEKVQGERSLTVHATGVDKRYVAAGLAWLRDEDQILGRRKEPRKGKGKGKKKDKDDAP